MIMRRACFSFILGVFSALGITSAHADTRTVSREDGSSITYYFEAPPSSSYPLVVLFHGSTCTTAAPMFQQTKGLVLTFGAALLTIEKPGIVDSTTTCPQVYLDNNTIQRRVIDTLIVLRDIELTSANWNKSVVLAGGSEGGEIAGLVAPFVHGLKGVLMLASGGGLTMAEELLLLQEKRLQAQGASQEQIDSASEAMKSKIDEIKSNPVSTEEWFSDGKYARNTYKWWAAILPTNLISSLRQITTPIYIAHGSADTSCPIESSELLVTTLQKFNKNVTYKRYEGLEHNWTDLNGSHHPEVIQGAFQWLASLLRSESR